MLESENYSDTSRWSHLGVLNSDQLSTEIENGNAVYESDETINFRNELNGKFYVIKPKTLELPSLTYASLDISLSNKGIGLKTG